MAAWQWWNFCESQAPMGKEILRINMDETSACLWQGDGKGTVFANKGRHRGSTDIAFSRAAAKSSHGG